MENLRIGSIPSVIFCFVTGNSSVFLSTVTPWLSLALTVVSLISVTLIIRVNWLKLKSSNEKSFLNS